MKHKEVKRLGQMLCFHAVLLIEAVLVNHKRQMLLSREKEQSFLESSRGREDTPLNYLLGLLGSFYS